MEENEEYQPSNREKSRKADRVLVYCNQCDRQSVSLTEKCSICGARINRKKMRSKE